MREQFRRRHTIQRSVLTCRLMGLFERESDMKLQEVEQLLDPQAVAQDVDC